MELHEKKVEKVLKDILEILSYSLDMRELEESKKYTLYAYGCLSSLVQVIEFKED